MESATSYVPCPPKALALRLAAAGFQYPDAAWRERFAALLDGCRRFPAVGVEELEQLEKEFRSLDRDRLQAEHFRLFGPAPACTLDLAHHISPNPFDQAKKIADFAGFYKAFGVEADGRADHLPVVLEFLAYLEIKSTHADERGLNEQKTTTDEAARKLRLERIVNALDAFSRKLEQCCAPRFYLHLAALSRTLGGVS